MQTKQAKLIIKHEVATHGVVTDTALRMYCEHRISKKIFDKLTDEGKCLYSKKKQL